MKDRFKGFRSGIFSPFVLLFYLFVFGCQPQSRTNLPLPSIHHVGNYSSSSYSSSMYLPQTPAASSNFPAGWVPLGGYEDKSRWEGILIHHSATDNGNAAFIDRIHTDKGYDEMGYHFLINNGNGKTDGYIEVGSRWVKQKHGAHCRVDQNDDNYWNEHTIGICLIGNFEKYSPSEAQYQSLAKLVQFLQDRYHIATSRIKGHGDVDKTKCPGRLFSFAKLRYFLSR
jgi:hypothetical protein